MVKAVVLVVEDEQPMRELISSFLRDDGYQVLEAGDGAAALQVLTQHSPDLIIADIMMPFMDGFELIKEVRKSSELPFIFLSARGEEWDKVKGLRLGADDYIAKPFHSGELIARVETVLRRAGKQLKLNILKAGKIELDPEYREIMNNGVPVTLTKKEFDLLSLLLQEKGRTVLRERIMFAVWGPDYPGSDRTVDTHVKTLRMKLGSQGELIKTVRGTGYRLEDSQ
ncbi:response regulator transcription factor [Jeotgalibacillus sp. R-1-5s-1]|uniref:response regulator transcription factor n=1 Tax=Jeotgalibacillus sp. R-1-5s-1 TaxID=2555897 RepID=UPI00106DD2DC|nr:response regulator transcription factor [Jeotgalibacillus sp. R-1-5s-1]TFE00762.1 response regulator transcription factor [Jeotgalibacillus sp. R-1-5s-1]